MEASGQNRNSNAGKGTAQKYSSSRKGSQRQSNEGCDDEKRDKTDKGNKTAHTNGTIEAYFCQPLVNDPGAVKLTEGIGKGVSDRYLAVLNNVLPGCHQPTSIGVMQSCATNHDATDKYQQQENYQSAAGHNTCQQPVKIRARVATTQPVGSSAELPVFVDLTGLEIHVGVLCAHRHYSLG
jgi:hypothetical protein